MDHGKIIADFLGGWYFPISCLFLVHSLNIIYVIFLGGIKRLDTTFSTPEYERHVSRYAQYNRFHDYSLQYALGKLKVNSISIRIWMIFNSVATIVLGVLVLVFFIQQSLVWLLGFFDLCQPGVISNFFKASFPGTYIYCWFIGGFFCICKSDIGIKYLDQHFDEKFIEKSFSNTFMGKNERFATRINRVYGYGRAYQSRKIKVNGLGINSLMSFIVVNAFLIRCILASYAMFIGFNSILKVIRYMR